MNRIMIAGTNSGAGKTTVTIGFMKALLNRGYKVSAFKCGPDYIDPMFHSRIVGASARNLDSVFCDDNMIKYLMSEGSCDFSVIEGVMGYYDGVGNTGSSMEIARLTKTPAIIVIVCKGMSDSIGAVMKGFLTYKDTEEPNIAGFLFNRLPESLEEHVRKMCDELDTIYFGRLPYQKEYSISSRHLGLMTAGEIEDLREKVDGLAGLCEKYFEMETIIKTAGLAGHLDYKKPSVDKIQVNQTVTVAVADDRAFSFIYQDNMDFLERAGVEIVRFSPISDAHVPYGINGLILPGGYPELYARELSENVSMIESIRAAVREVPTIAECGGFMYLHEYICTEMGRYRMAGVIKGEVTNKNRLVRFGYVRMESRKEGLFGQKGSVITAHEFHYWDSDCNGNDYNVEKISRPLHYEHGHAGKYFYGGFPHVYFYGNVEAGMEFVRKCSMGKVYTQRSESQ